MDERLDNVCWLKVRSFGGKTTAVGAGLQRTKRRSMQTLKQEQLLEWQDGQTCKSDVKVLLHFGESKSSFSSRETRFCGVDDVTVLSQRKKIRAGAIVQQGRVGVNVLSGNVLRSERANACCTCVAMRRKSVWRTVRFSRAPRRLWHKRRYTIATRKKILSNAHVAQSGSKKCDKTDARCKNDVRTFLHFGESKSSFSSKETGVFGAGDVRMFLHRKKIRPCFW